MKIPFYKINVEKNDIRSVVKVLDDKKNWAIGDSIIKFEEELAKLIGSRYCLTFNSGTSALLSILLTLNLKADDEVIVPSFTFISTVNTVNLAGGKVVFADINRETLGLDPDDVERNITKKTRAIIVVHYAGIPANVQKIQKIAKKHKVFLIEDCAEALGSRSESRHVGSFGDAAIFSFCQNKLVSTGEGGALCFNEKNHYELISRIRSHGGVGDGQMLGYNFRLSNIACALGLSQLKRLDRSIKTRTENAQYFYEKIQGTGLAMIEPKNFVFMFVPVLSKERDNLVEQLTKKGVETKTYFNPIHKMPFYSRKGYKQKLVVTEEVASQVLCLPFFTDITKKELDYIVKIILNSTNQML